MGRDDSVFGLRRRERIAFLAENGQVWLRRSKAGPRRSKPVDFNEKDLKNIRKGEGRKCVWTAQAQRIAFLGKFGDARLGRLKKGPGRNEKAHFRQKGAKLGEAKTCLDRTGAS